MNCSRCAGMMVREVESRFFSIIGEVESGTGGGCRCINCGNYEDSLIRLNRTRPHTEEYGTKKGTYQRRAVHPTGATWA